LGNITSDLLIWTPDDQDTAEPDVYLAAMAQSMEDGLGERLRNQEEKTSAQVSLAADQSISTASVVTYTQNTGPTFNFGLTVNPSGSITLTRDGLYLVSVNVYTQQASGFTGYCVPNIRRNSVNMGTTLAIPQTAGTSKVGVTSLTVPMTGSVGDTIDAYVSATGGTTILLAGAFKNLNTFSVTLVTPT
jgi:hypothetical protein